MVLVHLQLFRQFHQSSTNQIKTSFALLPFISHWINLNVFCRLWYPTSVVSIKKKKCYGILTLCLPLQRIQTANLLCYKSQIDVRVIFIFFLLFSISFLFHWLYRFLFFFYVNICMSTFSHRHRCSRNIRSSILEGFM